MFDDRKFGAGFVGSVLLSAFALTGCADTRGGSIPYGRQLVAPDEQRFQTLAEDYKIAPMDTLTIKVFKAEDLSGDYSVDLAGHVSLPLVGQVEAANLTTDQLREQLTKLLGQSYFEHPDVSVAIKQSTAHVVTVDGAVNQPGQYPVATSLSLMEVVALAHGTSGDANARRVAVFRTIDGRRQAAAFDLTSIRRGQAKDPSIYAGDIVVVDGSKIKAVEKQIVQAVPLLYVFLPVL